MTIFESIKNMTIEEMRSFILDQIHSECGGHFDEDCEAEGYKNCSDCITKLLNRKINNK